MSKLAVATEAVKEAVVGTHEPEQLAAHTKARFAQYAVKDADSGELYLGPEEFINAVAPNGEDYVSHILLFQAKLFTSLATW
jgi:solute carrier family 25 aspartate/glutamate transporter 12/13